VNMVKSHGDGPPRFCSPIVNGLLLDFLRSRAQLGALLDLDVPMPRMGLTEEPTQTWEVPEPVPFEFPHPNHEPAVPDPEPVHA
jgi:hypothetical protein